MQVFCYKSVAYCLCFQLYDKYLSSHIIVYPGFFRLAIESAAVYFLHHDDSIDMPYAHNLERRECTDYFTDLT